MGEKGLHEAATGVSMKRRAMAEKAALGVREEVVEVRRAAAVVVVVAAWEVF